jgi:hypothetical protein
MLLAGEKTWMLTGEMIGEMDLLRMRMLGAAGGTMNFKKCMIPTNKHAMD